MIHKNYHIGIIGNGNVSFHLNKWFQSAGFNVTSIYTRNTNKHPSLRGNLDYIDESCDFIVLTVKDDAISEIVKQIRNTKEAIVLHTSGTVSMEVFRENDHINQFGVLYPLQTLQKDQDISIDKVPFLLEANNTKVLKKISALCEVIKCKYEFVNSENRLNYHLAAVIGSNFTNHLIHIAEQVLEKNGNDITTLKPLLEETIRKAFEVGALKSQTGPAKRNDQQTIQNHLNLLVSDRHKEIYQLISQSIISEEK